jgi:hypothetical protein
MFGESTIPRCLEPRDVRNQAFVHLRRHNFALSLTLALLHSPFHSRADRIPRMAFETRCAIWFVCFPMFPFISVSFASWVSSIEYWSLLKTRQVIVIFFYHFTFYSLLNRMASSQEIMQARLQAMKHKAEQKPNGPSRKKNKALPTQALYEHEHAMWLQ